MDTRHHQFMDEIFLSRFALLVTAHTGLQLRLRERSTLRDALTARITSLHLDHPDEYYRILDTDSTKGGPEWERLISQLTNNESYFFRDTGQMAVLRNHILPKLIECKKNRQKLRLWSAGCSTGEEAYSLAMLVDELLPHSADGSNSGWEIAIVGTDIDEEALKKARRGIYGAWSFRTTEPALRQRYFHAKGNDYQISETIRRKVTFVKSNLVTEKLPDRSGGIHDVDLILCRNVFIYFEHKAVNAVLSKFAQSLREGGYLMTGHAETRGEHPDLFRALAFPQSVVYQRIVKNVMATAPALVPIHSAARMSGAPAHHSQSVVKPNRGALSASAKIAVEESKVCAAEALYKMGDYHAALRLLELRSEETADERTLLLLAHSNANLGNLAAATEYCERLMKSFPFAARPYELLASIAQEQGLYNDSKLLLKKALYLSAETPTPYLELGELYRYEGDMVRARKMHSTALELLEQMPPDAVVGYFGGPTALEWKLHLKQLLAEGD